MASLHLHTLNVPSGHRILQSKDVGVYTPNEVRHMMGLLNLLEFE